MEILAKNKPLLPIPRGLIAITPYAYNGIYSLTWLRAGVKLFCKEFSTWIMIIILLSRIDNHQWILIASKRGKQAIIMMEADMKDRTYIAIDLKSFYASVECRERGLDALDTALVVADESRTDKTICLAVSPALKAYGIPGRCRLFEVREKIREANSARRRKAGRYGLSGKSYSAKELAARPEKALDFVIAEPRMALYIEYSTRIYGIYLRHISPDDIHVYSIDEVFIDATDYLSIYRMTAEELARRMILDVLEETGITATAGIGDNLYLAKVAMDIMAKHIPPDENGVRIARLDEMEYRRKLWSHRPLTDFWRVGRGYAKKLEEKRIFTMGDIARCSVEHEDVLYDLFGVNAELLIDHAWGWEPCTMKAIKAYRPEESSIGSGQVLQSAYTADKARLVVQEMADTLSLDLLSKGLVTDQIVLTVGYDAESLNAGYKGIIKRDHYGRAVPKSAHGTENLLRYTSSAKALMDAATRLFDRIVDKDLLVRRMYISACSVIDEDKAGQGDLFSQGEQDADEERERRLQEAALSIKKRFGRNSLLRAMDLTEGATARERNRQIGGHKA